MREDKYCLVEETYNEKYESISLYEEFCKAILGKQFDSVEKVCEEFFSIKGINMRFLPLEEERTQASFVRNPEGFYSVGISYTEAYKQHCCAETVYVLYSETIVPGFFRWYLKEREKAFKGMPYTEMLKIKPEIEKIVLLFEKMKMQ